MNPARYCDLHVHSVYSEGTLTPSQLVDRAVANGLSAMVLTDHNGIAGLEEMSTAAAARGIETMSGTELYVSFHGKTLHLLGYGFDVRSVGLVSALTGLQADHRSRVIAVCDALRREGFSIDSSFLERTPSVYAGFTHLISAVQAHPENKQKILRDTGKDFPTLFEIINRYFGPQAPMPLPQSTLPLEEAVRLITEAGGISILAHPGQQLLTGNEDGIITAAVSAGVAGIELLSPYHHWHQVERYQQYALRGGLLVTGGTDFHTDIDFSGKELIANQWQIQRIPYDMYTTLITSLNRRTP